MKSPVAKRSDVHGANNGELLAHEKRGTIRGMVDVSLKPTSPLAMTGNRYPITEVGVYNLTKRLIDVAESDRKYGECDVQIVPSKINGRVCTCMQVVHPIPRKNFLFNIARVHVDDELNIPVRYEAYDWPTQPGGQPVLTEEYTYLNVKVNVGLTDDDFNPKNANYNFKK
ncbi:MAG: DUF1571 domain-containing protein [Pirellulales bacterium]